MQNIDTPPFIHAKNNNSTQCFTAAKRQGAENKNMQNKLKYAKYTEYQTLQRYVFMAFRVFFTAPPLVLCVGQATVMQWTCLFVLFISSNALHTVPHRASLCCAGHRGKTLVAPLAFYAS